MNIKIQILPLNLFFMINLENYSRIQLSIPRRKFPAKNDTDNSSLKERRISLTWFNQQYGNPCSNDKIVPVERRKSQTENRPAGRFGN